MLTALANNFEWTIPSILETSEDGFAGRLALFSVVELGNKRFQRFGHVCQILRRLAGGARPISRHLSGLRKHGLAYFKQFLGPVPLLIPLFIPLEIISHVARMLSLGLRLFGNIFGEHTATNVFYMIPILLPFPMMALGIFGGTLQAFVFCMLTIVYIAGAEASEH